MKTANVATAKNQLSRLLRSVRRGETVVITNRNRPIARLVPFAPTDQPTDTDLGVLVASGVLTPRAGPPLDVDRFFAAPRPGLSAGHSLAAAVRAEREEGR